MFSVRGVVGVRIVVAGACLGAIRRGVVVGGLGGRFIPSGVLRRGRVVLAVCVISVMSRMPRMPRMPRMARMSRMSRMSRVAGRGRGLLRRRSVH